jgi:DNA-binding GntR family transcriptional regulator
MLKSNSLSKPRRDRSLSSLKRTPPKQKERTLGLEGENSASARIRGVILKRISDGTYVPGERLKELTLAYEFNMSQAPVREAFRALVSLGVLESKHYRGTHVRAISVQETQDVYQLRGYLEEIAARLIPASRLEQNIDAIEALQVAMRTAALTDDMEGFAQANVQFHRSIISLSSNQAFLKVWDSLEIAMWSRMNIQRNEQRLHSLAEIHQPIVDALKAGDLQQAGILLREHSFSFSNNMT